MLSRQCFKQLPVSAQREEFRLQRWRVRYFFDVSLITALTLLVFGFFGTIAGFPAGFRLQVWIGRSVRMSQTRYIFTSEINIERVYRTHLVKWVNY